MEMDTVQTAPTLAQRKLIAFQRFGLGARPGGFAAMGDPLRTLVAEVNTPKIALIPKTPVLPTYQQACAIGEHASERFGYPLPDGAHDPSTWVMRRELDARFSKHMAVPVGFVERLAMFWANHFNVNQNKEVRVVTRATVGQLERDVIRAHTLGKFENMLVGVMTHPAMIVYLDNQISVGPHSASAPFMDFNDINVNLAREIHELHTVGSRAGYTEADIKALALILSGWTFVTESDTSYGYQLQKVGQFIFKEKWHEPASAAPTFQHMGRTLPNQGYATGVAVLRWLARHPKTAEHLAFKMLRHFVTDNPGPVAVNTLKQVYLQTGGDLKQMALAMLRLPVSWQLPLRKIRTPYEMAAAQYRAMKVRHTNYAVNSAKSDVSTYTYTRDNLVFLHQPPWECLDPDGWDDDTAEWLNADAIRVRMAAAKNTVDGLAPASVKVSATQTIPLTTKSGVLSLGISLFGPNLSPATRAAISAAPNAKAALTILFVSPEFQRR